MKALAIIHYITNYVTKGDYSQYQRIMSTAIVRKAYEDAQAKATTITTPVRYADPNKFALQTFNRLAYEREVSGLLATSCLLGLPDHYSHDIKLRRINLTLFVVVLRVLFSTDQTFSNRRKITQHLRALYNRRHVC